MKRTGTLLRRRDGREHSGSDVWFIFLFYRPEKDRVQERKNLAFRLAESPVSPKKRPFHDPEALPRNALARMIDT